MLLQPLKMLASSSWGGGESRRKGTTVEGRAVRWSLAGLQTQGRAVLRWEPQRAPRLRAPGRPVADLWPRGGHPKELTAMTSPLLSVHNRKCSPPPPFLLGESGARCSQQPADLVSGPTPSILLAQGLWVQGLAGAAWAESQGEHWPRTAQPGDPEHPEGSRKGGSEC